MERERIAAGFRSRSAAASLKRYAVLVALVPDVLFPQPIGCGLIEAAISSAPADTARPFPQPIGCGLIEAVPPVNLPELMRTFPQPIGCGLIEAHGDGRRVDPRRHLVSRPRPVPRRMRQSRRVPLPRRRKARFSFELVPRVLESEMEGAYY